MSLLKQPRPRGFRHEFIYVDERKERLRNIERRAKEALAQEAETERPRLPMGIFRSESRLARKERMGLLRRQTLLNLSLILFLLLLLMALLFYFM